MGSRFVVCDTNAVSAILFRPCIQRFESHQTLLLILASTFLRKTTDIFKYAAGKHTVSMKCMSTYLVKHFRLTSPSAHLLTWFFLLFSLCPLSPSSSRLRSTHNSTNTAFNYKKHNTIIWWSLLISRGSIFDISIKQLSYVKLSWTVAKTEATAVHVSPVSFSPSVSSSPKS